MRAGSFLAKDARRLILYKFPSAKDDARRLMGINKIIIIE